MITRTHNRTSKCDAIVLATRDYGEADKIVTLFTREYGKIGSIARNAKKSRKRFGGSLEVFTRLRPQIVLNEKLSRLDSVDPVTIFPHIREDLTKIGYAGYACELVDRFTADAQPQERLYRLLVAYLEHLDSSPPLEDDRRFFEVNLLNVLGYRPPLDNCVRCGTALDTVNELRYMTSHGGICCGDCSRSGQMISPRTIQLLGMALRTGHFGKIRFVETALQEAGDILDSLIAPHLTRPLRSLPFLREALQLSGINSQ